MDFRFGIGSDVWVVHNRKLCCGKVERSSFFVTSEGVIEKYFVLGEWYLAGDVFESRSDLISSFYELS